MSEEAMSKRDLESMQSYFDSPGNYNAQSDWSTEGQYARQLLQEVRRSHAEAEELRKIVKALVEFLNHILNEATSWGDYEPEDGELERIAGFARAALSFAPKQEEEDK